MRILVAEDEPVSRRLLEKALANAGHDVTAVPNGAEALRALLAEDAPKLAVLDWTMPELDGVDVIRRVRALPSDQPPYIIILTAREDLDSILVALENGANDFVTKSHDIRELISRVTVGTRVVRLQAELARRVEEAERALAHIKRLQGLLPICSYCKKIRNDQNYWQDIEHYVQEHSEADFSHSVCPACYETILKPQLAAFEKRQPG
jgi:DNA-binding response OmpR family regulator